MAYGNKRTVVCGRNPAATVSTILPFLNTPQFSKFFDVDVLILGYGIQRLREIEN